MVIWCRKRGIRKVTCFKMNTISDMNTWVYWSSLLYEPVINFVFVKSPFGGGLRVQVKKKVIFSRKIKYQIFVPTKVEQ